MKDLFVNFIGAVVFSIIGYFYVKSRGEADCPPLYSPGGPGGKFSQGGFV
jgi:hypothetical protein